MVGLVRAMGPAMKARAVKYDLEASFPHENFADFRANGLLGVSIPTRFGGLGASYADYVRVSEEVGRHCGATGLTFNMHNATMLWCGQVSDLLEMTPEQRERHEVVRTAMYRGVIERGDIHSQPFSEGLAPGATAGVATRAVPVDGGWLVTGRKIFASLSGAATFYNVTCQVPGEDEIRLLGVPADGDGVEIVDDWDPLGMRGTVSRTLLMKDVFVPHSQRVDAGRPVQPGSHPLPVAVPSVCAPATWASPAASSMPPVSTSAASFLARWPVRVATIPSSRSAGHRCNCSTNSRGR